MTVSEYLGVHCPTCQEDCLPLPNGRCGFCDTLVIVPGATNEPAETVSQPPARQEETVDAGACKIDGCSNSSAGKGGPWQNMCQDHISAEVARRQAKRHGANGKAKAKPAAAKPSPASNGEAPPRLPDQSSPPQSTMHGTSSTRPAPHTRKPSACSERRSRSRSPMTLEKDWQRDIIRLAQTLGWKVAHFRPAQTSKGWRTAVAADGAGFPDLVMVRDRILYVELKNEKGRLTDEQLEWRAAIEVGGGEWHLWRPDDLDDAMAALLHRERREAA